MENFAAVVRSLLARIRALQTSGPGDPRPLSAVEYSPLYQVAPTAWGVEAPGDASDATASATPPATTPKPRRRRRLEDAVFGLPVPRGLPVT